MNNAYAHLDNELQQGSPIRAMRRSEAPVPGNRVVIYRRASSPGQGETESSVAAQREACLNTAKELGFSLIDPYVDPDIRPKERPERRVLRRVLAWFRRR
ncbi:recombinase family protein [Amycolatopsis sp. cmx-11-12]|uniref:recombinase family protein n=1 Tax=Amycolatopsis sp. cmx-11-12 TaxID=2785795 RepID=UPI00391718DF